MKGGYTRLFDDQASGDKVSEYADAHSTPLPAHITAYHAHASASRQDSEMLSSNFQSKLHLFLARSIGAKRDVAVSEPANADGLLKIVLEVGVYVGYSAMLWAHATGPDGLVTGLEYSPELAEIAQDALAKEGINNVEIIVGDAAETLPKVSPSTPYDIIFLDADKPGYSKYLSIILASSQPGSKNRLLRPGGLIIADNVLRRGHVADPSRTDREMEDAGKWNLHIEAVRKFNDQVVGEKRLESFLTPLWDGLSLIRLVD
ncbi:putative O-methyltransferase [Metarhizium acridum CQMa 102]|uniref:Putative O-methyltransferase n=1 Tax=Metarhizium acridum (strain CQMa 102) TaxID=655827 RepID=E9E366_METAQ|nr:putative O-methyltransferase [Metarhizium acridum CQMa 102]EFY89661.1 putative O-methyltransferase [Metarhizium acridum CQMa 102]